MKQQYPLLLDPQADSLARQTDFEQQECTGKITGKRFAVSQVFGLLQRGKIAMSDLSHFAKHTGMKITGHSLKNASLLRRPPFWGHYSTSRLRKLGYAQTIS